MIRIGLKDVPLNDYALDILKGAEWFIQDEHYKAVVLSCESFLNHSDEYISDQYLQKIMDMGDKHDGFPEIICAHSFVSKNIKFVDCDDIAERAEEINKNLQETIGGLVTNLCMRRNALFAVYPPGGFISWHNNANASAYNIIFTWSETGDGYFKYWDPDKKEIIIIPDVKGWQCKAGYFGSYDQDSRTLCYHAAENNCLRMTIAFTLSKDEMALGLQDMIIEDISS